VYSIAGFSKQAFHKMLDRKLLQEQQSIELVKIVRQVRKDHPRMGARNMYELIQPDFIGRDKFEKICFENGFKVTTKPNYKKTTNSWGVTRFDNLIKDIELNSFNQVWVSDITYFELNNQFVYITLIMDLYSRKIIGHALSKTLRTGDTTLPAIKMAIKARKGANFKDTIFHSDGGGQYYAKEFRAVLKNAGLKSSMAENVYENPHAERINRTIKSDYIKPYKPSNHSQLKQCLRVFVLFSG